MTGSYGQPALTFTPDEEDLELPFGDVVEVPVDNPAAMLTVNLAGAVGDLLDALESGRPVPANRLRAYRELVGRPAVVDEAATPQERADEGIARAAARWTAEEVAQVDAAIRDLARRRVVEDGLGIASREFTTADVWAELGAGFPVTKGIAGRMKAAAHAGIITNTGRTTYPPADAPGPNNGQRLTVWRAL